MDAFEQWVRGGLGLRGMEIDETDLHIMRIAHAVYGPHVAALQAADLEGVWEEADLDPGREPSGLEGGA